jgi:hypothetical protein
MHCHTGRLEKCTDLEGHAFRQPVAGLLSDDRPLGESAVDLDSQ